MSKRVASQKQRIHAFQRGYNAWALYGKSINDNPYRPGLESDEWVKGYLHASKFKVNPLPNHAPEGKGRHKDSYVVVKRTGNTRRLHIPIPKEVEVPQTPEEINQYLGYIKPGKNGRPKRFFPFTNNPPEDMWRNKIADKSYKPEKDVEST